ncbi:MAG TPA: Uma2 family endonuclease [Paenibacillus sp.]|nr:Uma2 family endonuclease [Paenibacillus sp.]
MTKEEKKPADRVKEEPFTYDRYAAMPDDGNRYEIVDGALELLSPGPSPMHQSIVGELAYRLKQTCSAEYLIFCAPLDVILSATDVRQPDLVIVHRSRASVVTRRGIEGPPDLVAEVLSPGSRKRDKIGKMATYAKYGVPAYWIVDPDAFTLEQYVLGDGPYELRNVFEDDDEVVSDKLPCVSFRVSDLFRDLASFQ